MFFVQILVISLFGLIPLGVGCARKIQSSRLSESLRASSLSESVEANMPQLNLDELSKIRMNIEEVPLKDATLSVVRLNLDGSSDFGRVVACPSGSRVGCKTFESSRPFVMLFGLDDGAYDIRGSKCFRNRVRLEDVRCGTEATQTITYKKIANPRVEALLKELEAKDLAMTNIAKEAIVLADKNALALEGLGDTSLSGIYRVTQAIGPDTLAIAYRSGSWKSLRVLLDQDQPSGSGGGLNLADTSSDIVDLRKEIEAMKAKQKKKGLQQTNGLVLFSLGEFLFVTGLVSVAVGTAAKVASDAGEKGLRNGEKEDLAHIHYLAKELINAPSIIPRPASLTDTMEGMTKSILEALLASKLSWADQQRYYGVYKNFYAERARWLENEISKLQTTDAKIQELKSLVAQYQEALKLMAEYKYSFDKAQAKGSFKRSRTGISIEVLDVPRVPSQGTPPISTNFFGTGFTLEQSTPTSTHYVGSIGGKTVHMSLGTKEYMDQISGVTPPETAPILKEQDLPIKLIAPPKDSLPGAREWKVSLNGVEKKSWMGGQEQIHEIVSLADAMVLQSSDPTGTSKIALGGLAGAMDSMFNETGKALDRLMVDQWASFLKVTAKTKGLGRSAQFLGTVLTGIGMGVMMAGYQQAQGGLALAEDSNAEALERSLVKVQSEIVRIQTALSGYLQQATK